MDIETIKHIKQELKELAVYYRNGDINIYEFNKQFDELWVDLELDG